jgi:flagellar hook-associated protein 1 FlgK
MAVIGLFDIGRSTLLTSRRALDTTAHNVANAATPGYTRQNVMLENIPSGTMIGTGVSGRGARIIEVRRMYDAFTSLQLMNEKSNLSYWNAYEKGVIKIENIFNEALGTGISPAITGFFNSWREVAQNPEGHTQRTLLIKNAEHLSLRLNMAYKSLSDLRSEIYKSSVSRVDEVNSITSRIADLNEKIASSPGALDLKDQRGHLLERLNQIAKVTTFEDNAGRYNILIGGTPLVDGGKVYSMSVSTDIHDNMQFFVNLPHEMRNVTNHIAGGELKANLDLRDNKSLDFMHRLNAFAINLADSINFHHRRGFGLDGSTGNNFFNPLVSITDPAGGGTVTSVSVVDVGLYSANINKQYRIDYRTTAAEGYQQEGTANIFWRVQESTDGATWTTIPFVSVALTFDTLTTPHHRTLTFNGVRVRIDGNQGALTTPEIFGINPNRHAAQELGVAITDPRRIAAAQDGSMLPGDNRNARAIADLINQRIIAGTTPVDYYRSLVADAGVEAMSAKTSLRFYNTLVEELERKRQEISGVSLDEEAANLIKYQKLFEAGARMIRVADELLETLINMVGR